MVYRSSKAAAASHIKIQKLRLHLRTHVAAVKDYYNQSTKWYQRLWYDKKSLGIHYGFWGSHTRNRGDSLVEQYRLVKKLLRPEKGELILDAGCGVGGASLWLAEHTEARYIGITISEDQIARARKFLQERGLKKQVTFLRRDYFSTKFKNKQFEKIFLIESGCYAYPHPLPLYHEMYRILKPGGVLVISDGVYLRKPRGEQETQMHAEYCKGFKLADMCTPDEISETLIEAGFSNIRHIDKTREIQKSMEDADRRRKLALILSILQCLGLATQVEADNLLAVRNQKKLYDVGLFGYAVFRAIK